MDMMKNSSCELLSISFPMVSEVENLRWTNLVNFMFNSFLSFTAIMLNIVTIHAVKRTSSLPNTLKTLLLNLVVTDVGVGLINQPVYSSLLAKSGLKVNDQLVAYATRFSAVRLKNHVWSHHRALKAKVQCDFTSLVLTHLIIYINGSD